MTYSKIIQNFIEQTGEIDKTSSNNYNNINDVNECARMLNAACHIKNAYKNIHSMKSHVLLE